MTTTKKSTAEDPKATPENQEPAHTPADPKPDEPRSETKGGTIKYTGDAGVREITAAQWKAAGVEDQEGVVWDASNDYTLPLSKFSADAQTVLGRDRGLKISES